MSMRVVWTAVMVASVVAGLPAQGSVRTSTAATCAAELGTGVKTTRTFCDVLIGAAPADSIAITIPRHSGAATLLFELHNRFTVPAIIVPGALTFARHEAMVAIVQPTGDVLSRAAVIGEFRTPADLFDQIGGGTRPGGVIAVAPGPSESIRITIPAGVTTVGIVGVRLRVMTRASGETYDTPGRPVAIVSNVRVQYRP
ncbi:MAG: hypothetical protein IT184_10610 [Acidobacteria bacterium]|nr:hypothetical protein [Acidobacteriota bacterium]